MADPNVLDFIRIPSDVLVALDWRPFHFALQPYHYLVRMTHVASMAAFFGAIAALDLRLMGWRPRMPLQPFADLVLPWLYATFTIVLASGTALFFYDPVHVGSHAYFSLKLLLTALGLLNAALFRRSAGFMALATETPASAKPSAHVRLVGAVSLLLWTGVVFCACLNVEAAPKMLLR
jgi:nitroreductase